MAAGDVTGDGLSDILTGGFLGDGVSDNALSTSVIPGGSPSSRAIDAVHSTWWTPYSPPKSGKFPGGYVITPMGDVNYDGYADFAFGGHSATPSGLSAEYHEVIVVHGPAEGAHELVEADARILGPIGAPTMRPTGADLDGDGRHDLILGVSGLDGLGMFGEAFFVVDGAVEGRVLASSYPIYDEFYQLAGVANVDDIDGDGTEDLLTCGLGVESGESHLILGASF
jgi:hypothetical protein